MTDVLDDIARYSSPLFSDVERTMEAELGPLVWDDRLGSEHVTLRDGRLMDRAGLTRARGVPLAMVKPAALGATLREIVERHDFVADGPIRADGAAGFLYFTAHDGNGAEFTFRTKGTLEAWVDLPRGRGVA